MEKLLVGFSRQLDDLHACASKLQSLSLSQTALEGGDAAALGAAVACSENLRTLDLSSCESLR